MKKLLLLLFLISQTFFLSAQLNMTLQSQIQYDESLSDVWGYAAANREYALVGLRSRVAIVDVTDAANPVELGFADGPPSTWRDIKVHKDYAYVTNEEGGGLLVIDLQNLPNPITADDYYYWTPVLPGNQQPLSSCHNIFIDEFGIGYLIGCEENDGGPMFIDLETNPGSPEFIAYGLPIYSHDVYVKNNIMYSADIYEGYLSIHDVSDKQNVQLLATQTTPFDFTHNVWISDDGNYAFTTDEVGDAPVAVYDISDLDDIKEVDQFRPLFTLGQGVLPHNVFVWNQWLVISYYADGCILVDSQRPENLIEVGNFDTVLPGDGSGAWGVYPFLPSETVLVTDINNGLYILEPNYVEACFLEGRVTDSSNGAALNEVYVDIDSPQTAFTDSDPFGEYKTGQAIPGTFPVTFTLAGYYPKTVDAVLVNGELTILDVELDPIPSVSYSASVVDAISGDPIPNAPVSFVASGLEFNQITDGSGSFNINEIPIGDYDVIAGSWGYKTQSVSINISQTGSTTIELEAGYTDDFFFDFGWSVSGNANAGIWERGIPKGTFDQFNTPINPGADVTGDFGEQAYVTGNQGETWFDDDVDDGVTRLISPMMDLSNYISPVVRYRTWFFNGGGNGSPNDFLEVIVSNGLTEVTIQMVSENSQNWNPETAIVLSDFIDITDNMQMIFSADDQPSGHVMEAGVDDFSVTDSEALSPFMVTSPTTNGCIPLEVTFTDPNTNTTAWEWTFDGAIPNTSTEQSPTVVYVQEGLHSVSLVATTDNGSFTLNQFDVITISPLPIIDMEYTIVNDSTVVFESNAVNGTSFMWDFGDGNTSTDENPTHIYSSGGIVTATLFVTNQCGGAQGFQEILINLPTSVEEQLKNHTQLSITPNPFMDQINVAYELPYLPANVQFNIYNLVGELVDQIPVTQSTGNLQTGANLAKGIYFLQLQTEGLTIKTQKLIKH